MPSSVIRRADHSPPWAIPAEGFSTQAHEMPHEMLHHSDDDARLPKSIRETEAAVAALVVCRVVGLDTNSAGSDYIQLYAGDKDTLAASLDHIHRTSTAIINVILDGERAETPW